MRIPEQCLSCAHKRRRAGEGVCRVRQVQICERWGGLQLLRMRPGFCSLLNPDNACTQYSRRLLSRLLGRLL